MSLNSIGILFNTPNLQCLIIFFKMKEQKLMDVITISLKPYLLFLKNKLKNKKEEEVTGVAALYL